jgi:hypothetical protein
MVARRALLVSALILGFTVLGWWLGEDISMLVGNALTLVLLLILSIALTVATFLALGFERGRAGIAGIGAVITLALGFWGGSEVSQRAFNECLVGGESVRERLDEYKVRHGFYPKALSELPGRIPCQRTLRGSLLEYSLHGKDGYKLRFGDWLVTHEATDKDAFLAVK